MVTTDAISAVSTEKKTRQRSPNYPAVGLEEALERLRALYKADGKAGAPPEIAAKHIGYATAHGQAYSVLSALKKFGLLDEANGRVVPTQRAIELLHLPENDPRRIQALRDAALSPPVYRELIEQHKNTGLPSDEVLEGELITYGGFNPKAVKGFVKDFRESLEFSDLADFSVLFSHEGTEMISPTHVAASGQPDETTPLTGFLGAGFSASGRNSPAISIRRYPLDISIGRNLKAELSLVGEYKLEDLEKLRRQVERLIEGIGEAYKD